MATLALVPSTDEVAQRSKSRCGQPMTEAEAKNMRKRWKKASATMPTKSKRVRLVLNLSPWSDAEGTLVNELDQLWEAHKAKDISLRGAKAEVNQLRMNLGERLHAAKELLVGAGRGGKWSEFLRCAHIPKSSADRWVEMWKRSQLPKPTKLSNEELSEPSTEVIAALVKKLKPQLVRTLTTPASISLFMADLAATLSPQNTIS